MILAIARNTCIEAFKNRMVFFYFLLAAVAVGLVEFVGQLTLLEHKQAQISLLAFMLRLLAVFFSLLMAVFSVTRDQQDKTLALMLALPMPRAHYFGGKALGFCVLGGGLVGINAGLLALYAPIVPLGYWSLSLLLELAIIIVFSLWMSLTFQNPLPAIVLSLLFYLLARNLGALQLIAAYADQNPGLQVDTLLHVFFIGLSWLLPPLHLFTQSEWLLDASSIEFMRLLPQAILCIGLLSTAALVDLYRKVLA